MRAENYYYYFFFFLRWNFPATFCPPHVFPFKFTFYGKFWAFEEVLKLLTGGISVGGSVVCRGALVCCSVGSILGFGHAVTKVSHSCEEKEKTHAR